MKVLILEDNLDRITWFRESFPEYTHLLTTENPALAIEFLKVHEDLDTIYLDHDLLREHYDRDTNCKQTTGLAVAIWLAAHPENNPSADIVIHSRNWSGVGRMASALVHGNRKVTCYPFNIMSGLNI